MSDADHKLLIVTAKKCLITSAHSRYKKSKDHGYIGPSRSVHHVLPCAALNRSKMTFLKGKKEPQIKLVIDKITVYDVNETPNLLGLPGRRVYAAKFAVKFPSWPRMLRCLPSGTNPLVVACDYPIHFWNHYAYSEKAETDADAAWRRLSEKIDQHPDTLSGEDIGGELRGVSEALLATIEAKRAGITEDAWRKGNKAAFDMPA